MDKFGVVVFGSPMYDNNRFQFIIKTKEANERERERRWLTSAAGPVTVALREMEKRICNLFGKLDTPKGFCSRIEMKDDEKTSQADKFCIWASY